jgi:hypothetical protein
MAAAERYGVARPRVDRVIAVAERYGVACPGVDRGELAPVSLDTTLSTGTEKEWPS